MKHQAKAFAEKAHQGQRRKVSNTPYITHPIRVAKQLEKAGFTEEVICAGYLHDVVEDTPYEIWNIEEKFGQKVAHLVSAHTEDKSKAWQERKQHTIDSIKYAGKEVKYLIIADKLDNLLDVENGLKLHGNTIWQYFNTGYEQQKWYNESIAKNMYMGIDAKDVPNYFKTFEDAVKRVFT